LINGSSAAGISVDASAWWGEGSCEGASNSGEGLIHLVINPRVVGDDRNDEKFGQMVGSPGGTRAEVAGPKY